MNVARDETRYELMLFLRSRRAKLSPDSLGIKRTERRRTPGLTRDEVASLAGIGSTTYTFLEQGRPINVSTQILDKLSEVLLLNAQEKRHLFRLAIGELPRQSALREVTPEVQSMLNQYGTIPAFILNRRFDVVAINPAASLVFGFRQNRAGTITNLLLELTSPAARERFGKDQYEYLRNVISFFRLRYARYLNDGSVQELVNRLKKYSSQFNELWNLYEIYDEEESTRPVNIKHEQLGTLTAHFKYLMMFGMPEFTLCVVIPLDGTDAAEKIALGLKARAREINRINALSDIENERS